MNPIRARSLALSFGYHFICMAHCLQQRIDAKEIYADRERERERERHTKRERYSVVAQLYGNDYSYIAL